MSMISSLIDELNKSADEWNSCNMFELARMCRDAADTIWQLRDDLQRTNAENARLRSELESVGTAAYLYGRSDLKAENASLRSHLSDDVENARMIMGENSRLREQNAKLRELVADMWFWHYEGHIDSESQERQMLHIDGVLNRMHELGVEVGK